MEEIVKKRIKEVIKGDQNAFGEIVELYKDKVFQLCYRMLGNRHEAEDIAQEAFIRAYVNINSFNINLKFSTWLYRIATNLCIDRIRKKNRITIWMQRFWARMGLRCIHKLRLIQLFLKRNFRVWSCKKRFKRKFRNCLKNTERSSY